MRTTLAGLALVVGTVGPASASGDLAREVAVCVGRMSAEMEFRWLMNQPASGMERDRAAAIDILDAIRAPGDAPQLLGWRIEAKQAQAALLTRSAFGGDPEDAEWAAGRAASYLEQCRSVLLPVPEGPPGA